MRRVDGSAAAERCHAWLVCCLYRFERFYQNHPALRAPLLRKGGEFFISLTSYHYLNLAFDSKPTKGGALVGASKFK